ncbi:MAG: TIGR02391 family protein [Micrococcales bacterium]|nr:TIGR02391 family protein [Micrococcales bacterium]
MTPLPSHFQAFGITKVTVVHNPGSADEERFETEAHIQAKTAFFAVDTPIYEGDVVEFPDPRGGIARKVAASVDVNNPTGSSFRGMEHIHVTWGTTPPPHVPPVRRLSIENLHAEVIRSSSDLFADGHYEAAVSEAFKSIEVRVRNMTSASQSGVKLMGDAFGGSEPRIAVAQAPGLSGRDEQEGFAALFRGSMLGVRNPRAHELFQPRDPQQALEYLGFASLLHRRLDVATVP